MTKATPEQIAAKRRAFRLKLSLATLLLLGATNAYLLIIVLPKFERIYADAFPGITLPEMTRFVIFERIPLVLFTLTLPIPALIMFWRQRAYAILWIYMAIFWFFAQAGLTIFASTRPLMIHSGDITGVAEAPLKPGP